MTRDGVAAPPVAGIDERACIGCALCLEACPVDAIVGAPQRMHTVIAAECTGCGWCVPACPVDCIAMVAPASATLDAGERRRRSERYRRRVTARAARLASHAAATAEQEKSVAMELPETVQRALERARRRLARKS